jgi:hypothetical protein
MQAGEGDAPHNSVRSRSQLRTVLVIAGGIVGLWLVFVTTAPAVVNQFTRQPVERALATVALRSFPVVMSASGILQHGIGSGFVVLAPFSQAEDVQLSVGQAATVTVDALPGLSLPATVHSIETSPTEVGGVPEYYAELRLSQSDPRLHSGQTGSVDVTVASAKNVLCVPSAALFTGANNALHVDVWSGGQAYATNVQIGIVGSTLTQITSGLQAGEQVVLSPTGQSSLPTLPAPSMS